MITITGHNGFIGSHLKEYLKQKKIDFILFQGDLYNKKDVESFFQKQTVEQVIFLAGAFGSDLKIQLEKNIVTLQVFLETGVTHGLKKIIYLSSGAVYGEPIHGDKSNEIDPLYPNTLYGLSKLFAEECIHYYARNKHIQFIIFRLPNVYGKNNKKGVVYNFLSDIQKYKKITIAGDGTQERDFLHVNDVCVAIEKALYYTKSDIFNISNTKSISINQIVELLQKKYTFSVAYRKPDNNLKKLSLTIDKARNLLKFTPSIVNLNLEI